MSGRKREERLGGPDPSAVHDAMMAAPHDGRPFRQARAAIEACASWYTDPRLSDKPPVSQPGGSGGAGTRGGPMDDEPTEADFLVLEEAMYLVKADAATLRRERDEARDLLRQASGEFCGGSLLSQPCRWKPQPCFEHRRAAFLSRLDTK